MAKVEELTQEEKMLAFIDALEKQKKTYSSDMLDCLVAVIVALIMAIVIPIILRTYFTVNSPYMYYMIDVVQIVLIIILVYVFISRTGFILWDISKALSLTIKTSRVEQSTVTYTKYKRAQELYSYMDREKSVARRIISLLSLAAALAYLQNTEIVRSMLKESGLPTPFSTDPFLIFFPTYILIVFMIAYLLPVLTLTRGKIKEYLREVETGIIPITGGAHKCPVCGNTIPLKSIHCPFCGARLK